MANYSINQRLSNVSKGNMTFVLTPDDGYLLPDNITVSNGTLISYNPMTGVLVIDGTDNTQISGECFNINGCVRFASANSFTLSTASNTAGWNGSMYYSTDNNTWSSWNGANAISSAENNGVYYLYLRGKNNTVLSGLSASTTSRHWILTGSQIVCNGNIENLLNYETVLAGNHPTVDNYCCNYLFYGCSALISAPDLSFTTVPKGCCNRMFSGCTGLINAPVLSATTLSEQCYDYMFSDCTALINAPALPATTLASNCYAGMFSGCTALVTAPELPATTLAGGCYGYMFNGCSSLTEAPELPVTDLTRSCYTSMFRGCTSLTEAPALPAITLASSCYMYMFYQCTSLTTAPSLPATTLANYCYSDMFNSCTSLVNIPASLPATTLFTECYYHMFYGCNALKTLPELPALTLTSNCYKGMFENCTNIKLSATQTSSYTKSFRIPSSGTGTVGSSSLTDMFFATGGSFKGTPTINTTYYLWED